MVDKVEDININKLKMKGNVGKRDDLNLGKTTSSQEPSSMEKSVDERVTKSKHPKDKTPGMYCRTTFAPQSSQVQIILNFCSIVMITKPVFVIECEITWTTPAKVVQRSLVNYLETLSYLVFYLIVICKIK